MWFACVAGWRERLRFGSSFGPRLHPLTWRLEVLWPFAHLLAILVLWCALVAWDRPRLMLEASLLAALMLWTALVAG